MTNFRYLVFAIVILFLSACDTEKSEVTVDVNNDLIAVSEQQFESEKMNLGQITKQQFMTSVMVNGTVTSMPNGNATVGFPMPGRVSKILVVSGQTVSKGQAVVAVSGVEVIELQNNYAESAARLKRLESEYNRISELYTEKVIAEKEFIATESEYKIEKAKLSALALKLSAVGISTDKIDNGQFVSSYFVSAPINGVLSNIGVSIGESVNQNMSFASIVNANLFQLRLSLFMRDVYSVKSGQRVLFSTTGQEPFNEAKITYVGNQLSSDSKTVTCYAQILGKPSGLVQNAYVNAQIITQIDSAYALPLEAILKSGDTREILVLDKKEDSFYYFYSKIVKTGRGNAKYVELIGTEITRPVLIDGVYNFIVE